VRLLLIIPGAIGDFILTLPSVTWICRRLKPVWLEIWAERVNLELAEAATGVNRARALVETGVDHWPPPRPLIECLKSFETVVSWRGANHQEWREVLEQHHPGVHFLTSVPADCPLHAMDFRRSQVETLFGTDDNFPPYPEIRIPQEALQFAQDYLSREIAVGLPVVMIHPGASGPRKRWPASRFAELVLRLAKRPCSILLAEGPLDQEPVQEVLSRLHTDGMTVVPRAVRIGQLIHLAAVIRLCTVFVANDSGISHLAAATGTPTLAIFMDTNPTIWAPRGPRVEVLVRPELDSVVCVISSPPFTPERQEKGTIRFNSRDVLSE
jgi:heptosyltransferase-3